MAAVPLCYELAQVVVVGFVGGVYVDAVAVVAAVAVVGLDVEYCKA